MAKKLSTTEEIGMLLAQADATPHEEEKKLFMERAQKVAARNSIDLATARAAVAKMEEREKPTFRRLAMGKRGQRALSWYVELMIGIAQANDLRITMAHNSTSVTLYGMPSDIEVAEAIYATAITAMVEAGDSYLKVGDYKTDVQPRDVKVRKDNPWYSGRYSDEPKYIYEWTVVRKPVSGMTARQNFYKGFCSEIRSRLSKAKMEAQASIIREVAEREHVEVGATSTDIVLREKGKEVGEFYTQMTGKLGAWRGSKSPVHSATAANAGRSAAKGVDLGGRKALPGPRTQLTG